MKDLRHFEVWFVTGSQHLYGEETLKQVAANSREIAAHLEASGLIGPKVVWKPTVKTPDEIYAMAQEANSAPACVGLITWMHTFSPSRMWIRGFTALNKPFMHLHTQHNRELPWATIDMDFMNLNQAAHGDREHGYIGTRLGSQRKVVAGYWKDEAVIRRIDAWARAACAWSDSQGMKFARLGDNMRQVAVTEGNKVSAQIRLGWEVNGYGVGELAKLVNEASEADVDKLMKEYKELYKFPQGDSILPAVKDAARIEAGLRAFLARTQAVGFTTTFEDLHGLKQLPGLPAQRLMADGFGFGAEGDWKTACLVRAMKVMAAGLKGGTSFMEDYTYHLEKGNEMVLGAHMLEVCPTIAKGPVNVEVHPLGIGGKEPPARLVFNSQPGPAVNASLIDLGSRFRLVINEVEAVDPPAAMPKLPVARVVWKTKPDFAVGTEGWILAGGAHHTGYSQAIGTEHLLDYADMAGIEAVVIGPGSTTRGIRQELRQNEGYYGPIS